jgi:hypothetical protein
MEVDMAEEKEKPVVIFDLEIGHYARQTREQLKEEGFSDDDLKHVESCLAQHGLSIGSQAPQTATAPTESEKRKKKE